METHADTCGHMRTQADIGGHMETQADAGGRRRTQADTGGIGRHRQMMFAEPCSLNRLCTVIDNTHAVNCDCGEPHSMAHLLCHRLLDNLPRLITNKVRRQKV